MDKYLNFTELKNNELDGRDYVILSRKTCSSIAVIAPHGGGIEPGTLDIADAIAGREFSFYSFKGIKKTGNRALHIESTRFDEPEGLEIVKNAFLVLSVHGCKDRSGVVYVGGQNSELKQKLADKLTNAGFDIKTGSPSGLRGIKEKNICNQCRSEMGLQLEISMGLRKKMFGHSPAFSAPSKTEKFYLFTAAVRKVLLTAEKQYYYYAE